VPRPRKPDEQHILAGTWRADRHGDPSASVVATGEPEAPPHLKGAALAFWREVVPLLVGAGLAKAVDAPMLAQLCEWHTVYRGAMDALLKKGGRTKENILASAIAQDKFTALAQRFGLSCLDRTKLRADAAPKKSGVLTRDRSRVPPSVS
jgi:P27 family predicted phage terminase small subunit